MSDELGAYFAHKSSNFPSLYHSLVLVLDMRHLTLAVMIVTLLPSVFAAPFTESDTIATIKVEMKKWVDEQKLNSPMTSKEVLDAMRVFFYDHPVQVIQLSLNNLEATC
jgi:hypothetical protein